MEKRTLKFQSLIDMAMFSKLVSAGYLMNTNNFTLTGAFTQEEIQRGVADYKALLVETSEKVYSYETNSQT
ncbi:MAG: hypothetical protein ACXWC7_12330 [Chitinophagaceae bacterium]